MSRPSYLIAQIDVDNHKLYFNEYGKPVVEQFKKEGAELLVATRNAKALEGEWHGNWTVIVKFPNAKAANSWYNSSAYAPFRQARIENLSTSGNIVLVPGSEPARGG